MLGVVDANLFVRWVSSVLKLYRTLECVFSDNHTHVASMPYTELLTTVLRKVWYGMLWYVLRRGTKGIRDFFLQWSRSK